MDCIEAAARYLATDPAAVERALDEHRCGADGYCTTCGDRGGVWPCVVQSSALRAQSILAAGTSSPG
jgi:hypothetical protein